VARHRRWLDRRPPPKSSFITPRSTREFASSGRPMTASPPPGKSRDSRGPRPNTWHRSTPTTLWRPEKIERQLQALSRRRVAGRAGLLLVRPHRRERAGSSACVIVPWTRGDVLARMCLGNIVGNGRLGTHSQECHPRGRRVMTRRSRARQAQGLRGPQAPICRLRRAITLPSSKIILPAIDGRGRSMSSGRRADDAVRTSWSPPNSPKHIRNMPGSFMRAGTMS